MGPAAGTPTTRLRFLDASRGVTLFFVLVSHLASVYFAAPELDVWRIALIRIGMIATPTFVILSGMLLGVHYHTARAGFTGMQTKLVDRGLFLLLVSHVLIAFPQQHWAFVVYSTDGLGVAMILGAVLVPTLPGRYRVGLSLTAYAASWLAICFWHPALGASNGAIIKELLFGSLTPSALAAGTFPVVPWFAVYLTSSVIGERLAALRQQGRSCRLASELALLGVGGVGAMAAIKVAALRLGVSRLSGTVLSSLFWVGQKSPPAPLYLLFYGGMGLLIVSACLVGESRQWFRRTLSCAAVCGEVSLFVYLAHFYMFWVGGYALGPGGIARAVVYFALSTAALILAAHVWQHRRYNRFFTVRFALGPERFTRLTMHLRLETVPVMWGDRAC